MTKAKDKKSKAPAGTVSAEDVEKIVTVRMDGDDLADLAVCETQVTEGARGRQSAAVREAVRRWAAEIRGSQGGSR